MIRSLFLLLALALPALAAQATEIDLSPLIAEGKWALAYKRVGELKPFHYTHNEEGVSYTCIEGNPRTKIFNWIKSKGCTIDDEAMDNGAYRMKGSCELKWWKGHPIPVTVTLRPETQTAFTLEILATGDSLLGFSEHTKATHLGPCDPPPGTSKTASTAQRGQDQDGEAKGKTEE